ncbi:purine catabolism regulatory protein [Streptomyces sp. 2224.1]|uniref:PucR family transcriptional regulator n=1 Tax=unclassified Streptomyces TaxID=2593676 RepID=UPI00088DF4C4|nr:MULTISPECIES: PucR family transcriptional regulator [unclassified Streptomyces]PBC81619.1 purine catabolism regulator [Streptomyces sp. 2321.6]SDR53960.1 purine catabolism regulatory protein [Streptomyces sp. KS_16]SEC23073.1 purine catabolism regulatory protein [Streptomyces sp. 2133.1]SED10250.1 purine catabolism regulatory protein [Streptomyces sp. 2224.1]SEF06433.1 purine catabolism regulatory protein [Streptomyces sp. 2112.3]
MGPEAKIEAEITVRRALELPALRRGLPEVLAGEDRLDRPVRWVHAGEVPHIASLLKGGELLLTTGLGLGARPSEQRAFIRKLADREIAALVVELGSRFASLPAALVDAARDCGLPLIQLHREVPYVTVTEAIHTEIINSHYALLRRADEVLRRCTDVLLRGGGAPEVLRLLAVFTGNPLCLEAPDGSPLYAAGPDADEGPADADPLLAWEGLRDTGVRIDVPGWGSPRSSGAESGGGPGPDAVRARLVLLPVNAPLAPVHRIAAERAADLLAVVMLQSRQEEVLAARGRGDFLADLAEGRISAAEAPGQARLLGFRPGTDPVLPVVMRLPAGLPSPGSWALLAQALREELAALGVPVLLGVRPVEGRVPMLIALRAGQDRDALADRIADALRAGVVRTGLDRPAAHRPVVVVGTPGDWAAAGPGLRHVTEAAAAAQGLPEAPWYDARRLDIELLLWRMREHGEQGVLSDFVERAIGPLLAHDRGARQPLLPTLEAYLASAGRKAETARDLNVNRQTLYDRLARIAQLLGTDLDDPQTVLGLRLALRARRHTDTP